MADEENNTDATNNNTVGEKPDSNIDGDTAESLIHGVLNRYGLTSRTRRLGDKWPRVDIYGEFEENNKIYFFFFQIKSSRRGFTPTGKLNVSITKEDLNEIARYEAPTYFIGVDLEDENPVARSYILIVRGVYDEGFSTMISSDENKVCPENFAKLRREIIDFWNKSHNEYKKDYYTSFELRND